MSVLATILIAAATKVGAPIVKSILQDHVGGVAGELGGTIIDAIAEKAGVPAEDLSTLPQATLEDAIARVEPETPALVHAYVESQKEANRLMLAEMQKEGGFGWLWRPAGMWLMLACTAWYVIVVPLINTLLSALGARSTLGLVVDFASFIPVFMTYAGLYMGGNTVIRATSKGKG
jgi:hypothetical protein